MDKDLLITVSQKTEGIIGYCIDVDYLIASLNPRYHYRGMDRVFSEEMLMLPESKSEIKTLEELDALIDEFFRINQDAIDIIENRHLELDHDEMFEFNSPVADYFNKLLKDVTGRTLENIFNDRKLWR